MCLVTFLLFQGRGPPLLKAAHGPTSLNPALSLPFRILRTVATNVDLQLLDTRNLGARFRGG